MPTAAPVPQAKVSVGTDVLHMVDVRGEDAALLVEGQAGIAVLVT